MACLCGPTCLGWSKDPACAPTHTGMTASPARQRSGGVHGGLCTTAFGTHHLHLRDPLEVHCRSWGWGVWLVWYRIGVGMGALCFNGGDPGVTGHEANRPMTLIRMTHNTQEPKVGSKIQPKVSQLS